jgi:integrase/recombinase XerD
MGTYYGRGCCPERACRRVEFWPEMDRALWLAALVPGDLLSMVGARSNYRPISNRKVERGYGRWLTFLELAGFLDWGPPGQRITPAAVQAYVADLRRLGNASQTVLARLQELYEAALVMDSQTNWIWIRRIAARVRAVHVPARDKRSKMVHTQDLVDLGFQLMARAEARPDRRRAPLLFRDGLLVALVSLLPLRRRNVTGLEIGQHLFKIRGEWQVLLREDETKAKILLEYPWPEELVEALGRYLGHHRLLLCGGADRAASTKALWITCKGAPMASDTIYGQLVKRTKAAFGKSINPHLFRDIAATTQAHFDPEHIRSAAQLLGHRSFATTEKYYVQAQTVLAARRYQQSILELRHSTRR